MKYEVKCIYVPFLFFKGLTDMRNDTLNIATSLLNLPMPDSVQSHTKSLLSSLFPTSQAYYNHKVKEFEELICNPILFFNAFIFKMYSQ